MPHHKVMVLCRIFGEVKQVSVYMQLCIRGNHLMYLLLVQKVLPP
jgi:hypothetical protein